MRSGPIKLIFTLIYTSNTAVSLQVNATSPSLWGTAGPSNTMAQPVVPMCEVVHNGLGPIGDGPPRPEDYSTACSCSDLIRSFVHTTLSSYNMYDITGIETVTTVRDPNYLYVPPHKLKAAYILVVLFQDCEMCLKPNLLPNCFLMFYNILVLND